MGYRASPPEPRDSSSPVRQTTTPALIGSNPLASVTANLPSGQCRGSQATDLLATVTNWRAGRHYEWLTDGESMASIAVYGLYK